MARVLVTGGTGFIGSHICDRLIELGHEVVCFDNMLTSDATNIEHLIGVSGFTFIEGDIRDIEVVSSAIKGCTHVCHQAALGSVPRSIEDPVRTNDINLVGGLNILVSALENEVERFVFASSSSVYGDDLELPKIESRTGRELSPYAVSKSAFESYASVFHTVHGIETIGLRYFNVFGPRQSPDGPYAAVIPKFLQSISEGKSPKIFGDGKQTRDFTYVKNVVHANEIALFGGDSRAFGECYNVACGETVSIASLYNMLRDSFIGKTGTIIELEPEFVSKRPGDIKDSLANLDKIENYLGYKPEVSVEEGIEETVSWFIRKIETGEI